MEICANLQKYWNNAMLNDGSSRVIQTYVVNFICQKVQNFWADSDYLGEIINRKL